MAVTVETLDKLERRITLTLSLDAIQQEVDARLKRLARTVKADGFRPGKVPLSVVAQRYGYSVQHEVMNDQLGQAFSMAAKEAELRVAGAPHIEERAESPDGQLAFNATFEVYPVVTMGDFKENEVERVHAEVSDEAIEKTLDILRKQRRTFNQKPATESAVDGDRATINFEGKIDGEIFAGGQAENFQFVLGEGRMLEAFEKAVRGMKVGESKTFPLTFPEDYHGKEVAGKEADFLVTLTKLEASVLPELTETFIQSLGIQAGTLEALKTDIQKNLEREIGFRTKARNKAAVMDVLLKVAQLDVPKVLVENEVNRLVAAAKEDLKARGVKDIDKLPLPREAFSEQAEQRVRLGLAIGELVRAHELYAKAEQIRAHIEELAQSYEQPAEVVSWYMTDRQRMAEVEAVVIENNVADYIMSQVKVVDKNLDFEELMSTPQ